MYDAAIKAFDTLHDVWALVTREQGHSIEQQALQRIIQYIVGGEATPPQSSHSQWRGG